MVILRASSKKKLNALYYMVAWVSYHIGGSFYVKGGAGKLSDAFAEEIEVNGGDIYLSNEVIKIEVDGRKVIAIETKKGERHTADKFIFACDPIQLTNLMDSNNKYTEKYKEKLQNQDIGISLSQLYVGLDCRTTEVGINKGDYIIKRRNHEAAYENAIKGDYSNTTFGITSYDILDPDLNKDIGVFAIVIGDNINNWPEYKSYEYKSKKEEVKEELLNLVCEYFPQIKGHIKVLELATPHTMKRYTNNSEGAVYGFEQNVNQGGFKRLSNKTDFSNVFLAGAWTNPGGGFEGAITGGILTASRLLREEKLVVEDAEKIDRDNDDLTNPDMDLNTFMIGMTANFDSRTVAKDEKLLLEFIFDNEEKYYIKISNRKARLLRNKSDGQADVVVKAPYKVWFNIAFCGLDGRGAMFDGKLTVLGNADIFLRIPEYFNTKSFSDEPKGEEKKLNILFWLILTLIPWIVTGIISEFYLDGVVIALGAILYTTIVIQFIKPKQFKELTKLEGVTLITFALYGVGCRFIPTSFETIRKHIMDIILILSFLISAIIKKPITEDYSRQAYGKRMVKTKLFKDININLTLLWALIFFLQLQIKFFVSGPLSNLSQILAIIGLIISYYYPKLKMSM